ncbi:H-NS family nucleoid-associated regulatory protein [Cupriavidus malaysiensis]|uniref:DNA-binding protein H-NS-like C-terminal domain-containing protein n=1 Tax=Cupriavidus malaysiensis TaxID=367825 RepID=A0ABM6F3V1_9BURK|nr:H-NS family nucleoid-associated regulatory protein [Cupriavidus malaysiensis]AOZ05941.1 hypothetical protein BKK80_08965 [Cupriavidus malaysiensis]
MSHKPGDLLHIRALDLIISPRNQRNRPRKRVREIGASLVAHGQIENLTIIPHVSRKKNAPAFEVIDGGTRLEGAHLRIGTGELPESFEFLCMVADPDQAEEISVAANMHEAMHPADEFDAFKRMIDSGSSIEEIAARFGATPLTVQRRLKLANVSPRLVQGYRDGELNLDQLMALAITDDHAWQEQVWKRAKSQGEWQTRPDMLRAAIAKPGAINAKTDRLARFVGLDAYEEAGGPVLRDLFSDGGGYIGDGSLLKRLALEKLEGVAERVREEGWSWVEANESISLHDMTLFGKSQPKKRDLTDEEQAELGELQAQAKVLDEKIQALDIEDEALSTELGSVEARIEEVEARREIFTDRQKAKAGVIVRIDMTGELSIHRGLIRPEQNKKKAKSTTAAEPSDADPGDAGRATTAAPGEGEPEALRPLSERLVTQLTAHRTSALQALVADNPCVALAELLYALVPPLFDAVDDLARYDSVAKVSLTNIRTCGQGMAPDLEGCAAWTRMDELIGAWEERLPRDRDQLFPWLLELSHVDKIDLLAVCVAHSINTVEQREDAHGHAKAHRLAAAVDLDMADWWAPTAGSYLASVPKARRLEAVREAAGQEAADAIAGLKKETQIGAAEERLVGRRWLPAILRGPGASAAALPDQEPSTASTEDATEESSPPPTEPVARLRPVRYRDQAGNTWSGRGKRPAWIETALASGKALDELLAEPATEEV